MEGVSLFHREKNNNFQAVMKGGKRNHGSVIKGKSSYGAVKKKGGGTNHGTVLKGKTNHGTVLKGKKNYLVVIWKRTMELTWKKKTNTELWSCYIRE